jgi:hypothetical protein
MARDRHNILKEGLTGNLSELRLEHGFRRGALPQNHTEARRRVAYLTLIRHLLGCSRFIGS